MSAPRTILSTQSVALAALMTIGLAGCVGMAPSDTHRIPPPPAVATGCTQLKGLAIPAAAIGLPTTGATLTDAAIVPAAGAGMAALGEYCRVLAACRA